MQEKRASTLTILARVETPAVHRDFPRRFDGQDANFNALTSNSAPRGHRNPQNVSGTAWGRIGFGRAGVPARKLGGRS
jgi:hypothetical protein